MSETVWSLTRKNINFRSLKRKICGFFRIFIEISQNYRLSRQLIYSSWNCSPYLVGSNGPISRLCWLVVLHRIRNLLNFTDFPHNSLLLFTFTQNFALKNYLTTRKIKILKKFVQHFFIPIRVRWQLYHIHRLQLPLLQFFLFISVFYSELELFHVIKTFIDTNK